MRGNRNACCRQQQRKQDGGEGFIRLEGERERDRGRGIVKCWTSKPIVKYWTSKPIDSEVLDEQTNRADFLYVIKTGMS